jgi:tetratricopeptide (TPR) repeat protein
LQARLDLSRWADAPVQKAQEEFEVAIHEDPSFANAYSGLASAYVLLAEHGAAPREPSYRQAQAAAEKAIQLAPSTAEAHAILGQTALRQDWNFEVAERELRRAIELDQSRALYHLWLSALLCEQSRFDDSLHEIDLARAADPLWAPVYWTEAATAGDARQFARSIQAAEKLAELMPNWPPAYDQRGWAYWFAGRETDAIADWRRMAQMENDTARMRLEDEGLEALRRGGVPAYARLRLKAIQSGYSYHHASSDFSPAEWYSIAGEYDKALAEVEQMMARHDPEALQLAVNPTLTPLHNQPRFVAALIRIGLNQPKPRASAQIGVRPVPTAARPFESRERADLR